MQEQAKNKNFDYATKYRQMAETKTLEDAFEALKEKIELRTNTA